MSSSEQFAKALSLRIGVISDTHIPEAGPDIPGEAYDAFADVDLILHLGDMHVVTILDRLESIAPVIAARGNGDPRVGVHPLRPGVPEDDRIEDIQVVELAGWKVGLIHDLEEVVGRPEEWADSFAVRVFGQRVDIAIFGHTHIPMTWGLSSGMTILNPGSPTLPYGYRKVKGTIAILELSPGRQSFEVLDLATGGVQMRYDGPGIAPMVRGPRPVGGV